MTHETGYDGNDDHELTNLRRRAIAAVGRVVNGRHFEDWLTIGEYIETGRRWAMKKAETNNPKGPLYNQMWNVWLARNPQFTKIDKTVRNNLMRVMENLPAIRHFLDGEEEPRKGQLNHPTTVLRAWKAKEAGLKNEASKRKAEQAHEEALMADDGTPLGVPDVPARKPLDRQRLKAKKVAVSLYAALLKEHGRDGVRLIVDALAKMSDNDPREVEEREAAE